MAGPDDICAPLLEDETAHCHNASVIARDDAARLAIAREVTGALEVGALMVLSGPMLARLRQTFLTGAVRGACAGCEWKGLCDRVAPKAIPTCGCPCDPAKAQLTTGFRNSTWPLAMS